MCTEWLNSTERYKRKSDQVSVDVNRRIREDQNLIIQNNKTMNQNWDKSIDSTDLESNVQDTCVPDQKALSDSESESESELPPLTPWSLNKSASRGNRRQPSHESKKGINYKGIFALFGKQTNISGEITSSIVDSNSACLSALDSNVQGFTSTVETLAHQRKSYLSADSTYEITHPLVYAKKFQSHGADNPTYSDIIKFENEERNFWELAMVKELKFLRDLGSFKMVSSPRKSNVLKYEWAFNKK